MRSFLIITTILFVVSGCGRRGTLEKPENEGVYPRQYPAPEEVDTNKA